MPRDLPHWTNCAPPGSATTAPVIEIVGFFLFGFMMGTSVTLLIGGFLGELASLGCVLGEAFLWATVAGLSDFIYWYDNRRLMCIRENECAVGTVVTKPSVATDGDVGLNLALIPPKIQLAELQDLTGAADVVAHLQGMASQADVIHLYQDLVHNRLLDPTHYPNNDVQKRFIVKTSAVDSEHPGASAHIPDDSFQPSGPTNPLFRGPITDDPDAIPADIGHPWIYMHTEIEGHNLIAWLENLRDALIAGALAWLAGCVVCMAITGAEWACGWVGALLAFLIALLVWLIKQFGTNEPYDASVPEVDIPEDFSTPDTAGAKGDVAVVFGRWIMDMEHEKYFEIHPVKAWYRVCNTRIGPIPILDDHVPEDCFFDPSEMAAEEYRMICEMVRAAETKDPIESRSMGLSTALTHFAGIRTEQPPEPPK